MNWLSTKFKTIQTVPNRESFSGGRVINIPRVYLCEDNSQLYGWFPGDSSADDGVSVIAPTNSSDGKLGNYKIITPNEFTVNQIVQPLDPEVPTSFSFFSLNYAEFETRYITVSGDVVVVRPSDMKTCFLKFSSIHSFTMTGAAALKTTDITDVTGTWSSTPYIDVQYNTVFLYMTKDTSDTDYNLYARLKVIVHANF